MADLADPETNISSDFPFTLHKAKALGYEMAYIDTRPDEDATSEPVALFLHGNPTSSYLWRNVVPHVSPITRCIAPDLIGMGSSSKLENSQYRFVDHYTYLSALIDTVIPFSTPILLVAHDWPEFFSRYWPCPDGVSPSQTWEDFSPTPQVIEVFKAYRGPNIGRELIIQNNHFIERALLGGIVRPLISTEMSHSRKPYLNPQDRELTYARPNQVPIAGHPPEMWDIATKFHEWLMESEVPKLLFYASPGSFVTPEKAVWYARHLKNVKVVGLGKGLHFLQEDHPSKIGRGIGGWIGEVLLKGGS